jgi:hypothetical protein
LKSLLVLPFCSESGLVIFIVVLEDGCISNLL